MLHSYVYFSLLSKTFIVLELGNSMPEMEFFIWLFPLELFFDGRFFKQDFYCISNLTAFEYIILEFTQ